MKKLLLTLLGIVCSIMTFADTATPITSDYTFVASTYFTQAATAGQVLDGHITCSGSNSYSSKTPYTVDGVTYTPCLQVKTDRSVSFTVSAACTLKIYGTYNESRSWRLGTTSGSTEIGTYASVEKAAVTISISETYAGTELYLTASDSELFIAVLDFDFDGSESESSIPVLEGEWSTSALNLTVGDSYTAPTFTVESSTGETPATTAYSVAYSLKDGSATGIATVDASNGITAITTTSEGTATVVATLASTNTENYTVKTTTYECVITVSEAGSSGSTTTSGTYTVSGNEFNLGVTSTTPSITIGTPSSYAGGFSAGDVIQTSSGVTLTFSTAEFGYSIDESPNNLNSTYEWRSRGKTNASWSEGSSLSGCYYQFANPSTNSTVYVVAYVRITTGSTLYLTDNGSSGAACTSQYIDYYTMLSDMPRTSGSNGITNNTENNESGAVIFELPAGATRNLFVNGARMYFYGFEVKTTDDFILKDTNRDADTSETNISTKITTLSSTSGNQVIALGRTLQGGAYNTICLPFDLTLKEVRAYFGSEADIYSPFDVETVITESTESSTSTTEMQFQFEQVTKVGLQAGLPYLIKPGYTIENPAFYVTVSSTEAGSTQFGETDYYLKGTYAPAVLQTDGTDLYMTSNDGTTFTLAQPVGGGEYTTYTMKGFRAYFTAETTTAAEAAVGSSLAIVDQNAEDDGTTAITVAPSITEHESYDRPIYNLQGMRVNADYKGIVIINGKKVLKR